MSVADFHAEVMSRLERLASRSTSGPCRAKSRTPCRSTRTQPMRSTIRRWCKVLAGAGAGRRVFKVFRARFIGKVSPVHFFWGSFDLAVTRFSGRTAPPPGGVTPNVAVWVMAEAYSHEVSSCGFWPGNGGYGRAAFYVYAYPEPAGYGDTPLAAVPFTTKVGPVHPALRCRPRGADPGCAPVGFPAETYEAAANLAKWRSPRARAAIGVAGQGRLSSVP